MADARREHEHDVAIAAVGYFGAALAKKLRPDSANPYRDRGPARRKTRKELEEESKEGFAVLGAGLKFLAGAGRAE